MKLHCSFLTPTFNLRVRFGTEIKSPAVYTLGISRFFPVFLVCTHTSAVCRYATAVFFRFCLLRSGIHDTLYSCSVEAFLTYQTIRCHRPHCKSPSSWKSQIFKLFTYLSLIKFVSLNNTGCLLMTSFKPVGSAYPVQDGLRLQAFSQRSNLTVLRYSALYSIVRIVTADWSFAQLILPNARFSTLQVPDV